MGKIKKGILGGFSGKVGNVVGASWKGIDYIRSLPTTVKNPRTKAQVVQRSKFAVMGRFLKTITPLIRVGFKNQAVNVTPSNAAMSYNVQNAVIAEGDDYRIDFPNLLIASGSLEGAISTDLSISNNEMMVSWNLSEVGNFEDDDDVMLLVYNSTKKESMHSLNFAKRVDGSSYVLLPSTWKGDEIECYIAFKSAKGDDVSNSVYLGQETVPSA